MCSDLFLGLFKFFCRYEVGIREQMKYTTLIIE
jgi:hypothetical protein